jgi:hypothetical protein
MTVHAPGEVAASVSRALWGEVTTKLRGVQYRTADHRIDLLFYFAGKPGKTEFDSIHGVGAEVVADFPDCAVSEEAVRTEPDTAIPCQESWHTAFVRQEPTLAH